MIPGVLGQQIVSAEAPADLSGTATLMFTPAADLEITGSGELAGTTGLTFTVAGDLDITSAFTTFSTTTDVTLSNGNLTATHNNTNSNSGARSPDGKNSGKYYFEYPSLTLSGQFSCSGLITAAGTFTNLVTNGTNCVAVYGGTGALWANNASAGVNISPRTHICIAVDLDNDRVWVRGTTSDDWNENPAADPATNTGGFSLSNYTGTTLAPAVGFGGSGTSSSETITANFGASAFSGTVPSGFTAGWPV